MLKCAIGTEAASGTAKREAEARTAGLGANGSTCLVHLPSLAGGCGRGHGNRSSSVTYVVCRHIGGKKSKSLSTFFVCM